MLPNRARRRYLLLSTILASIAGAGSPRAQVASDIVADGSLATQVTQNGNLFDIDGGTTAGSNLFHSFGRFSVGTGDTASFNGPAGLENIIARVTGGLPSSIDGTLQSTIVGANLYVVNPAGMLFGPGAVINVGGSFHATTADVLRFGDGGVFFADPGSASSLSAAPVSAFGFLTDAPAPIGVESPSMQAGPGGTVSIVGGHITVGAADGSAPGYVLGPGDQPGNGQARIVGLASRGDVVLGAGAAVDTSSFTRLGTVRLQGNSIVDAHQVVIRGGRVEIEDAAVHPGAFSRFLLAPPPDGGSIDIAATDTIAISGGGPDPVFAALPGVIAFAGIDQSAPFASVPDVTLSAPLISLSGSSGVTMNRFGAGTAGTIRLTADRVTVSGGASVSIVNLYEGDGGVLDVRADEVLLDGAGAAGFTGFAAQSAFSGDYPGVSFDPALTFANSGTIRIAAPISLVLRNGAEISTDSRSFGRGGDIAVVAGTLDIDGGKIASQSSFVGDAGAVSVQSSGGVRLLNGGQISAATFGAGLGGTVRIVAGGGLYIDGPLSGVSSQTAVLPTAELDAFAAAFFGAGFTFAQMVDFFGLPTGSTLFDVLRATNEAFFPPIPIPLTAIPADRLDPGNGGAIDIITPALHLTGTNAAIDSSTGVDADAGDVAVSADSIVVEHGAAIGSRSGIRDLVTGDLSLGTGSAGRVTLAATGEVVVTGAGTTVSTDTRGIGAAGNVAIAAGSVTLRDGARVSSSTTGSGNAGSVAIAADRIVRLSGADTSLSTDTSGAGNAGNVSATAFTLRIEDGATVSSSSTGTGLAGDVRIALGDSLQLDGGAIATEAITSDGGNISITAPRLVELVNAEITTSVGSGFGNGGNIFIDPDFVVLQSSRIIANAFGGAGGNIDIIAGFLIVSPDSVISASSALGVDGIVRTTAPDSDVSAALAVLPASYLDAAARLQAACGAARVGRSSLTEIGRGGIVADPGGYLVSAPLPASSVQALYTNPRADAAGTSLLACAL